MQRSRLSGYSSADCDTGFHANMPACQPPPTVPVAVQYPMVGCTHQLSAVTEQSELNTLLHTAVYHRATPVAGTSPSFCSLSSAAACRAITQLPFMTVLEWAIAVPSALLTAVPCCHAEEHVPCLRALWSIRDRSLAARWWNARNPKSESESESESSDEPDVRRRRQRRSRMSRSRSRSGCAFGPSSCSQPRCPSSCPSSRPRRCCRCCLRSSHSCPSSCRLSLSRCCACPVSCASVAAGCSPVVA